LPSSVPPAFNRRRLLTALPIAAAVVLGALRSQHSDAASIAAPLEAPRWPLLQSLHGKVVLVDFWASWCAPCRRSFPWMNDLQQHHTAQGLVVVAVNVDQDRALTDNFLREIPVSFRLEYDPSGALAEQFNVQAMPTSFLIDRRGTLRARHAGFRDAQRAERETQIQQLLEESAT
jgi:cytochrome c biogenesis protein CcmG, thiol:disulfide interchange protein DsbE